MSDSSQNVTATDDVAPVAKPTWAQQLAVQLGAKVVSVVDHAGAVTAVVLPENWLAVAQQLRDDAAFRFEQLIDVCGVDYLSYGQVEWDTTKVSAEGFSRGVEGERPVGVVGLWAVGVVILVKDDAQHIPVPIGDEVLLAKAVLNHVRTDGPPVVHERVQVVSHGGPRDGVVE